MSINSKEFNLLPCPFCGEKEPCLMEGEDRYSRSDWYVWCPDCGCKTSGSTWADEAVKEWNTRAATDYVIPTGEYIYLHSLTLDDDNINLYCTDKEGEKFTLIYNKKNCQNLLSFLKIEDLANNELMKMVELDEPQEIEIARKYVRS